LRELQLMLKWIVVEAVQHRRHPPGKVLGAPITRSSAVVE